MKLLPAEGEPMDAEKNDAPGETEEIDKLRESLRGIERSSSCLALSVFAKDPPPPLLPLLATEGDTSGFLTIRFPRVELGLVSRVADGGNSGFAIGSVANKSAGASSTVFTDKGRVDAVDEATGVVGWLEPLLLPPSPELFPSASNPLECLGVAEDGVRLMVSCLA
jgi:hypothetical protein